MKNDSGLISLVAMLALCGESANSMAAEARAASHFATFGTNRVHYKTLGRGEKALVFVHGWSCNEDFWREQVPALADRAKLILIDLPGHGRSDKPRADYTMDFFGESVLTVMRDTRVNKAALIGHSMGVAVICRAWAKAPESATALVAVDGLLRRPEIKLEDRERFIAPFRGPKYRETATNFIRSMFPNPGTEALRDTVLKDMLATPQYVMSGAMEGMFAEGRPNWDLKRVDVPVLVINARNRLWTPEYEAYVKELSPKTESRTIEGAGHFLMLEKPAEFNAVLVDVLSKYKLID